MGILSSRSVIIAALCALGGFAGCGFNVAGGQLTGDGGTDDGPDDAGGDDGELDANPDDAESLCFGTYRSICLQALPVQSRTFAGIESIDTGAGGNCAVTTGTTGENLCVIAATSIDVPTGATLRGHGSSKPIVLIATTGMISVGGVLDVSTGRETNQGAGNNLGQCNVGMNPVGQGGGQGGSFGSVAGSGGGGAALAGVRGGIITLGAGELRGGCAGAKGGPVGGMGGTGGGGGGAVLLIANEIGVTGDIDASGSGGGAGDSLNNDGGGGAGSGGMIVLDAPSITISGRLWAEGGGGGEGGGLGPAFDGADASPGATAPGGSGNDTGGNGGAGSQSGGVGLNGGNGILVDTGQGGHGGGGGGTGFIRVRGTPSISGVSSPPPSAF